MKQRILVTVCAVVLGAVAPLGAAAQAPPTQDEAQSAPRHQARTPEEMANRLARRLGLTEDQKNQITPILADRQTQMQALRSDPSLSRGERAQQARKIMEASDQKIDAILTPDQRKVYADMQRERRDRMRERRSERQENDAY